MLKRVKPELDDSGARVKLAEANFPAPFASGLEYGSPARGTWNIVHTGMLIPEAHEIFVCASSCLRGVGLTAAEMDACDRFSTVTIRENNVLEGDMEDLVIEGVSDILKKLPYKPRAVLLYTSCIHHFIGCDMELPFRELRKRFPDIDFTDCYMNPIMRKSGWTPDQLMRRQLYSLLKPLPQNKNSVNIIGNNIETDASSDLISFLTENGFTVRDVTKCSDYDEYLKMGESIVNISYNPMMKPGGDVMEERLGQIHLYLPLCYGKEEIIQNMRKLADTLGLTYTPDAKLEQRAENALAEAKRVIGDTPIAVDYSATMRPLGLARLLVEHGFNVTKLYIDNFNGEERADFDWLRAQRPDIDVYPTVHAKMRVLERNSDEKILAIGQKAAYFNNTPYFVNIVEGGGMYGFDGIVKLADLIKEAFSEEKDTKALIQIKGLGCGCC